MTKVNKIPRVPTNDVLNFLPGFVINMDFAFFNVESIHGFTSNFVDIYSATSHPFGFPSRNKRPPLDILRFLFTTFRNQDNKLALIRVYEYASIAR